MSRRVRHIHADDDEYIAVHRTRSSSGGDDSVVGCVTLCGVALALCLIWSALCWIWDNITMILIWLGCAIGVVVICFLLWRFRRCLLGWISQILTFLVFLISAACAVLFWEIPKWLYKTVQKN